MGESKKIKQMDKCKIITSSKLNNNYLAIYVDNKPNEKILTKQIVESLVKNNLDFIVTVYAYMHTRSNKTKFSYV